MPYEINIKEINDEDKSWFNIKRFRIKDTRFERPLKSLDIKNLDNNAYDKIAKNYNFKIAEATKLIENPNPINRILNETDDSKINNFFHKKTSVGLPIVVNFTLKFNPHQTGINWSGFFDYYYQYSNPILTIPNIRTINPATKKPIISITDYIKFVDDAFEILDTKNHKPIFVPISLRLSLNQLSELLDYYLKKEYLYYWFDFEGKAINESALGRTINVFRKLHESEVFGKSISYFTNIKREITSNTKDDHSPASDVLASIAGANIIGVNREPGRPIGKPVPAEHKARLFNAASYYYIKTGNLNKFANVTLNSTRLDQEFANQTEGFLKENSIVPVIKDKSMLVNYKGGKILKQLTNRDNSSSTLDEWF